MKGKTMKKLLCVMITVVMLATMVVVPTTVSAEFNGVDINFEDSTITGITTDGMQTPTIVSVPKGDNKAIKLGSSWSGSIGTGMTMGEEGVYEISFSMMSNATQYASGQADRDKNFAVFLNKGTTTAAIIKNGYIRQSLDAASSWNGNGGMFAVTAGEWLDVELTINTKTNTVVSATYTQGTKTHTEENISLGNHDYTTIYLYNNATTESYVDDIKVSRIDGSNNIELVNMDFENDAITGITTDSMQTPTIVSVPKGDNKAIKLGSSWSGSIDTGMTMGEEGVYEISFSMMSNATKYASGQADLDKSFGVWLGGASKKDQGAIATIKNGYLRQSLDLSANWNGIGDKLKVTAGEWIDVKLIINTKTNTVVSATYTQGTNELKAENIALGDGTKDYTTIYLYNNATTNSYIDDIKVKLYTNDEGSEDDNPSELKRTIINFEDGKLTGVNGMTATAPVTVPRGTNANNKALKLEESWKGTIETGLTANSGVYEISFSLYPETIAGNNAVFFKDKTQAAVLVTYTNKNYVKQSIDTSNGAWNAKWVFDSKVGEWIDVKLIIDTDTNTVTSATYTQGNKSVTVTQTATEPAQNLSVSAENYATLNLYGAANDKCYIDDIVIRKAHTDVPAIDYTGVKMIDSDDNIVTNNMENVTPALKKITLDFGDTTLKTETTEGITLTGAETPEYVLNTDVAGEVTIELEDWLSPNKTYTITIPATVANIYNDTLGIAYIHTFTTGEGKYTVDIDGIYDSTGTTKIEKPDDITASSTIIAKLNINNKTLSPESPICIIGYYNADGILVATEISNAVSAPALTEDNTTVIFTTPSDLSDISAVKIFVWENTTSLRPVGGSYAICDEA